MKILISVATKREIEPLHIKLRQLKFKPDVLITGVGMVATTFSLAKAFSAKRYDAAINAGICGSFKRSLRIGEVVSVEEDILSELGAEDGADFLKLTDMKFADKKDVFLKPGKKFMHLGLKKIKRVKGITVNTVHGNAKSIKRIVELYNPDVESMEGAAFYYVCNRFDIPAVQLRAVSNYVERRDVKKWDIGIAVENLNNVLSSLL